MKRGITTLILSFFLAIFSLNLVFAVTYISDVYFTVPDTVYMIGENISLKGFVYQANYSNGVIAANYSALANAIVNLTITTTSGVYQSNHTFATDSSGMFYSRSNYYTNTSLPLVLAPASSGNYYITVQYINPTANVSYSRIEISVVNQTLDLLDVSSNKASYNPSEPMIVNLEATKMIGDRTFYVSNVSLSGNLRNSTKDILQSFSCTTGTNGKCTASLTAPSDYGIYSLELDNFKAYNSFEVVPFYYSLYIKDDTGKSVKNVFSSNEQGVIEVKISNASNSDSYSFSGYIANSSGNVMSSGSGGVISATVLNSTNLFTNTALFTISSSFAPGTYSAYVTVSKSGDGSITSLTSFQVQDWMVSLEKKDANSGFEYMYSAFPNRTLNLQLVPTYRNNGSVIGSISSGSFLIQLKDNLNNILSMSNASWNSSCGKSGCYEFSVTSPSIVGQYSLLTSLTYAYNGVADTQTESKTISVVGGVMSAESGDKDGNIKELFGTNEYAYLSLNVYNLTSSSFNLSDAEMFITSYMNGSEMSYTQVSNFSLINMSNSVYEWAWNSTSQKIKMDVPKFGGIYNVYLFGNNRTLGASAKFIVNPYDACASPKTSLSNTNSYYAWQFNTADTIYFDIKLGQAVNPSGRATAMNSSTNSSTNSSYGGAGAQCTSDSTKQAVSNATLTVVSVINLESGAMQNINSTQSTCQSSDNSGGYICTVMPLTKWEGGVSIVKFNIKGQDGATSIFYSRFEARSFYLYGWSAVWQNNPSSNITLNLQLYQAGTNWWQSGRGLSGTVKVKRVEYQGRDGEWLWPPIDSGYNVSLLNSSSVTSSNWNNQLTLPVSYATGGLWKTGSYRVVLQATTSSGDTDYGYAWFGVKLWDVYGYPIECTSDYCNYKSYFNSKENVTLYVMISKAGTSWWSGNYGGQDIYGNVSVSVKKIENCRTWPCKELNSSQYIASLINVNASSPAYSYASAINQTNYMIKINSTSGTWGTAWYQVTLNINGTDTGSAWFNTIAFYTETQPVNSSGAYRYNFRGSQNISFNVTTTRNYKYGNWYYNSSGSYIYSRYNVSDYVNVTIEDAVLRTWDSQTYKSRELSYPSDINFTPNNVNGNGLVNILYLNGTWPTGYYSGELTMKNSDNETANGYVWFNIQPFRVNVNTLNWQYNYDSDQCVNASLSIYDSDWSSSLPFYGNYSIVGIYETVWGGNNPTTTYYYNYSVNNSLNSSSFNYSTSFFVCPNSGSWGSGSWGGYHYLNILVKDNVYNDTQTGWLYFKTIPFQTSWGSVNSGNNIRTNNIANVSIILTKPSNSAAATGILTKLYQWRYDNSQSTREEYVFSVGNSSICYSNVSGSCTVNGTQTINIYPSSIGWRIGWNYIQAEWTDTSGNVVQDWNGASFNALEAYSGWFYNYWYDANNNYNYKYYFAPNENILVRLNIRDTSNNPANVSIQRVYYARLDDNCQSESCKSYTETTSWTNSSGGTSNELGSTILNISFPSGNWSVGTYAIKAVVSGTGSATITGGIVRVKEMTPPNITVSWPVNNATYNTSFVFSATTSKNANCYVMVVNYDDFYLWYCAGWNSTNLSNSSLTIAALEGACNYTNYNYSGVNYSYEYVAKDYHYISNNSAGYYCSLSSSCSGWGGADSWLNRVNTYSTSGGTAHTYTFNVSSWINQHYGMRIWCNDADWNSASVSRAFKINNTVS